MADHHFNPFIAEKYGVFEAIFLNNLVFWTKTNAAKEKNFHENRYWAYGTPKFFTKYFPYFSPKQIRNIIASLIKKQLILKSTFNQKAYDRTSWYSLSDLALSELNLDETCLKPLSIAICPNGQIDAPKRANGSAQMGTPIPDKKTDNKTNTPPTPKNSDIPPSEPECNASVAQGACFSFSDFWDFYPVKKGKKRCEQIWARRKLDSIAGDIIHKLQEQVGNDERWLRGYIPNPVNYLSQDLWHDEISLPSNIKSKIEAQKRTEEQEKYSETLRKKEAEKHKQLAIEKEKLSASIPMTEGRVAGLRSLREAVGMK